LRDQAAALQSRRLPVRRRKEAIPMETELPNPHEIEEHKANPFTQRVALCTAGIAVLLAIAGMLGGNAAKEAAMNQMQASNSWAYFQSKSTKQKLMSSEAARYRVELARLEAEGGKEAVRKVLQEALGKAEAEEQRYDREQKEIEAKATAFEAERNLFVNKDPYFDLAEVLLQIAIVMASVAMLATSRTAFVIALVFAAVGAGAGAMGHFHNDQKAHESHTPAAVAGKPAH
jgi:hypothetical protein